MNKNILKFKRENAEKIATVKSVLRKKSPRLHLVVTEKDIREKPLFDWKKESVYLDAWLVQMKLDLLDRIRRDFPGCKPHFIARNTNITNVNDRKYEWIGVNNKLRFAIEMKTCK